MSKIWGAYLEDFNYIKLIIPLDTKYDKIKLISKDEEYFLNVFKKDSYGNELYLHLNFEFDILPYEDYYVIVTEDIKYHLSLGKIARSAKFDSLYYYDGPLGFRYHKEETSFYIWSPVAKEIMLVLNNELYKMQYSEKGSWKTIIKGDLEGFAYYYLVRINDEFVKITDPYAISSSANHEFSYVIDWNKTYQMENGYYNLRDKNYNNAILYEINIRDINGNIKDDESSYLKAIEKLEYFKDLGITHIQIMPTFGFDGIDELIKDNSEHNFLYNWGYNPVQYMIPSGWYSSNANDPYCRINEFKMFIDSIHSNGLAVNMDVVFNHVYKYETFSLGLLVPGYVYRTDLNGFMMNSSYCGNDIRTEGLMNRRFIKDTLAFFQSRYMIDGFRFDLMGLIDNETMLEVKKELELINPSTMLYGEGWYMNTDLPMNQNANLGSAKILNPIAFFNDYYRNRLSGNLHDSNGFIVGSKINANELTDLVINGSKKKMPFVSSSQSINYIECHDNYTFYDKLKYLFKNNNISKFKDYCKLGLGLVLVSEGIPFLHGGSELMRSKMGYDNSYNSSDMINHFPWENINSIYDLRTYVKSLIEVRKIINSKKKTNVTFINNHYEFRTSDGLYQIIIKNNYEEEEIYFAPLTVLIFNNNNLVKEKCESLYINQPGIWVLTK